MNKLLLATLLVAAQTVFAQHYRPIVPNDVYYFSTGKSEDLYPIKIDSLQTVGEDSIFYLYKQVRKQYVKEKCAITLQGDSWLGKTVQVSKTGTVQFYNSQQKPILLHTTAPLKASWIAYESTKWKAEIVVSAITKETFLGVVDSVKTFHINILKKNGADTSHPYDNLELRLSKSHGLVKTVNFFLWDSPEYYYPLEQSVESLSLVGVKNLQVGATDIGNKEFFDFEVGDEFHVEESTIIGIVPDVRSDIRVYKFHVIAKTIANDAYHYQIQKYTRENATTIIDTIKEVYDWKENSELLGQITKEGSFLRNFYVDALGKRAKKMEVPMYQKSPSDSCWTPGVGILTMEQCTYPEKLFYEGLGGPYYQCRIGGFNQFNRKLLYYKKGNEEWGTPLSVSKNNSNLASEVTVSPNPAHDFVQFDLGTVGQPVALEVRDGQGAFTLAKQFTGGFKWDVSNVAKGLYFYTISNNTGRTSGKIVVQ